jgi:hypothetical protein
LRRDSRMRRRGPAPVRCRTSYSARARFPWSIEGFSAIPAGLGKVCCSLCRKRHSSPALGSACCHYCLESSFQHRERCLKGMADLVPWPSRNATPSLPCGVLARLILGVLVRETRFVRPVDGELFVTRLVEALCFVPDGGFGLSLSQPIRKGKADASVFSLALTMAVAHTRPIPAARS